MRESFVNPSQDLKSNMKNKVFGGVKKIPSWINYEEVEFCYLMSLSVSKLLVPPGHEAIIVDGNFMITAFLRRRKFRKKKDLGGSCSFSVQNA